MTNESLVSMDSWGKISPAEKRAVQSEALALQEALIHRENSKLAIGEHLINLQKILKPKGLYTRFLRHYNFSEKSSYRYIRAFKLAQGRLPQDILKTAMMKGMDILGDDYEQAIKELPPPAKASTEEAVQYLTTIKTKCKEIRSIKRTERLEEKNPEILLEQAYQDFRLHFRKLPANHKRRMRWVHELAGMMLTELGVGNPQTIAPIAVPADFIPDDPGRPKGH